MNQQDYQQSKNEINRLTAIEQNLRNTINQLTATEQNLRNEINGHRNDVENFLSVLSNDLQFEIETQQNEYLSAGFQNNLQSNIYLNIGQCLSDAQQILDSKQNSIKKISNPLYKCLAQLSIEQLKYKVNLLNMIDFIKNNNKNQFFNRTSHNGCIRNNRPRSRINAQNSFYQNRNNKIEYENPYNDTPIGTYKSRGKASGRVVFEGPLGGIYYLTESNNRTYIPFPSDDNIECLV